MSTWMIDPKTAVEHMHCPYCDQPPGQPCVSDSGFRSSITHSARRNRALYDALSREAILETHLVALARVVRDGREHSARYGTKTEAWERVRQILAGAHATGVADAIDHATRVERGRVRGTATLPRGF